MSQTATIRRTGLESNAANQLLALSQAVPVSTAARASGEALHAEEPGAVPGAPAATSGKPARTASPAATSEKPTRTACTNDQALGKYNFGNFLQRIQRQKQNSMSLTSITGAEHIEKTIRAIKKLRNKNILKVFYIKDVAEHEIMDNIIDVMREVFNNACGPDIELLREKRHLIACGLKDGFGNILGVANLQVPPRDSTIMFIPWIAVTKGIRSCGIGKLLLQISCQIQQKIQGRVDVFLVADSETPAAQRFYEREGFVRIEWGGNDEIDQLGDKNGYRGKNGDWFVPMRLQKE